MNDLILIVAIGVVAVVAFFVVHQTLWSRRMRLKGISKPSRSERFSLSGLSGRSVLLLVFLVAVIVLAVIFVPGVLNRADRQQASAPATRSYEIEYPQPGDDDPTRQEPATLAPPEPGLTSLQATQVAVQSSQDDDPGLPQGHTNTPDPDAAAQPNAADPSRMGGSSEELPPEIKGFLGRWTESWENTAGEHAVIDSYAQHYSEAFRSNGMSKKQWVTDKASKGKYKEWIEITVSSPRVIEMDEHEGLKVHFEQGYKSSNYTEKSNKILHLKQESAGWRIVAEETQ